MIKVTRQIIDIVVWRFFVGKRVADNKVEKIVLYDDSIEGLSLDIMGYFADLFHLLAQHFNDKSYTQ